MADTTSIQLLPEARTDVTITVPGANRWFLIGALFLILSLAIYGGLYFYASGFADKINAIDTEFKSLDSSRNKVNEAQLLVLKGQLSTVGQVLDNHIVWTNLLAKVQNKTSPQIQYKSLAIQFNERTLNIEAEAANFTVIAKQISSYYAEDSVENVNLAESGILNNGHIGFRLQVVVKPNQLQLKSFAQK